MKAKVIRPEMKGRFIKKNGFIYRTDTYIHYPGSEEIIGACVLCNPGSSRLLDPVEQEKLEGYQGEEDYVKKGELLADPTMRQLCRILEDLGFDEKGGKFLIYNSFTLRNGNMDKALEELKDEKIDEKLLFADLEAHKKNQGEIPWTLIGWGCKSDPVLNRIKKDWLNYLEKEKLIITGYKHKNRPHYYHPRPFTKPKQDEYVDLLVASIKDLEEKDGNH